MSDLETLDERLCAVERALTDRDDPPDTTDDGELHRAMKTTTDLAARVDDLETQLAELDAAVQALRGYVGNIRAVNDDVERRADAALAKAETRQYETDIYPQSPDPKTSHDTETAGQRSTADDDSEKNSLVTRLREVL